MSTLDFNPLQRNGRERRRRAVPHAFVELLESRQLMAYSPLGYSLPELVVSGRAAGTAAYGGQLGVTISVQNLGASSIIEPFALTPGATSTADAPATTANVYLSSTTHFNPKTAVLVGTVDVPAIKQNDRVDINSVLTLPSQPKGFPGAGKNVYLTFVVNPTGSIVQNDSTANTSAPVPLRVAPQPALPSLRLVEFAVPAALEPGDTIQPTIQVGNFGTAATLPQGPVKVILVASLNKTFNSGSSIVATYSIANIDSASAVVGRHSVLGDDTLDAPTNIATINGAAVTLPTTPGRYYLGVVIDPDNTIRELRSGQPANRLQGIRLVGAVNNRLPAANVTTSPSTALFPTPASPVGGVLAGSAAAAAAVAASQQSGLVGSGVAAQTTSSVKLAPTASTVQGGRRILIAASPTPTRSFSWITSTKPIKDAPRTPKV
ncbi:hypothetical protein EP7_000717 [Isosphaeraceae bacterium EP7]